MNALRRIPAGIALLFAADIALVLAPVADFLLGSPYPMVRNWLDLDSEVSLPAWYSSMQWMWAASLFALVPFYLWRRRPAGVWASAALALACLVFSVDEILGVHEWLGRRSDVLLPGGERDNTSFARTGIWPFLIGIPVVLALAVAVRVLGRLFARTQPAVCARLMVGLGLMFTGALIVELGKNLIDISADAGGFALLQVAVEEFLEMVGVTFIVWAGYGFVLSHGFALLPPHAAPEAQPIRDTARSPFRPAA